MEIGLYHPALKQRGGSERVVLEYAKNSTHDITIFTLFYDEEQTFDGFKDLDVEEIGPGGPPSNVIDYGIRFGLASLWHKPPEHLDGLIISETGLGSPFILQKPEYKTVCYCHTPLRLNLPEFREVYMEGRSAIQKTVLKLGLWIHRKIENIAWENYDKVFSNSEKTRQRIDQRKLWPHEEVEVNPPGVELPENPGQTHENFILYPSRFREYKRQDLAIEAFQNADLDDFKLVLAGSSQDKEYIKRLKSKSGENVEIITDVSQEKWDQLLNNSYCVVFTPEKEDWGMVPIEAGAYKTPVVGVDEGGIKETIDHKETGLRSEASPHKISEKLEYLAENPEKTREMGRKARQKAEEYTWKKFSDKIDREFSNQSNPDFIEKSSLSGKINRVRKKINKFLTGTE